MGVTQFLESSMHFPMNSLPCSLSDVYIPVAYRSWASTGSPSLHPSSSPGTSPLPGRVRVRSKIDHQVLVHITQHPSARLGIVKRVFQPLGVTPALKGGDGRVGDGNLEEDGRFFLGYECLGYEF